jgi:hypothetical protein
VVDGACKVGARVDERSVQIENDVFDPAHGSGDEFARRPRARR